MIVEEIMVKGRGLKFTQMAIIILAQEALPEYWAATYKHAMCWGGLKAYAFENKQPLDMDWKQTGEWVRSLTDEEMKSIENALERSEDYKKLIPDDKPDKKKERPKSTPASV